MTATAGLGFKPQHFEAAVAATVDGLWFEVHPENYMVQGGPRLAMLEALRTTHPLSLHGVGLSLVSEARPDQAHLRRLKDLVDRFEPFVVSEHLAWSVWADVYHGDLLPFSRSRSALDAVACNIDITQECLGRTILVENPSLYIALPGHDFEEVEFLSELVRRSGCGLLADINNVYISASNLHFDPAAYLDALPATAIAEIHIAGHAPDPELGTKLLIDTHGTAVAEPVWDLLDHLLRRIGPRPVLVERDENIPEFASLMVERDRAAFALAAVQPGA
jgi:uncharacterized protein (UPF0276 family)